MKKWMLGCLISLIPVGLAGCNDSTGSLPRNCPDYCQPENRQLDSSRFPGCPVPSCLPSPRN